MPDILEGLHYRLLFSSLLAVIIICDSIARPASLGFLHFFVKLKKGYSADLMSVKSGIKKVSAFIFFVGSWKVHESVFI